MQRASGPCWQNWRRDVEPLAGDRGISVFPFLFTEGESMEERSRKSVPMEELWGMHLVELPKQLGHSN